MNAAEIAFDPALPWPVIGALAAFGLALFAFGLWRQAPGVLGRGLAFAVMLAALAGPNLRIEERRGETDVAVALIDQSTSMTAGRRASQAAEATAALEEMAAKHPSLELRVVPVLPAVDEDANGTRLFQSLNDAFAGVPRDRRAGAIMITDGQSHDTPTAEEAAQRLAPALAGAPLHALLVGEEDEADRRVRITSTPPFALVGDVAEITFVVEDSPIQPVGTPARIAISIDGVPHSEVQAWPGRETVFNAPIEHAGEHAIELAVAAGPREVSLINNRALARVTGVRDRLRVLLISGQPHAGQRVWRNLLKSDPAVDLVHFTILRPPAKTDYTSTRELALIAFPIQELFERKLSEFDLIIFDRYPRRDLIPPSYLANIVEHVRNGGALLEAADAAFARPETSLSQTALGAALPAQPTGMVLEEAFRPALTDYGRRHPVTQPLAEQNPDNWGRWLRQVEATTDRGSVLLNGLDDRPLLALARFGDGRVAQVLSDQIWLWARGHEGGGPHGELLRRLAHWLMAEPELEETRLRAAVVGDALKLERLTVEEDASAEVTVAGPDGASVTVALESVEDGRAVGEAPAALPGLYRASEGGRAALALKGDPSGPEAQDIRADAARLAPALEASGGVAMPLYAGMPDLRMARPGRAAHGRGWIALQENRAYVTTSEKSADLPPAWLALALIVAGLFFAWARERS